MTTTPARTPVSGSGIIAALALASTLAGCASDPVVVTSAEQAGKRIYACPNARTLEVTRAQGGQTALVVVDGRTLQLPRVTGDAQTERYSNRLQTLSLFGDSASFDSLGQGSYGPCSASPVEGSGAPRIKRGTPRDRD